jgi:hypothetical protein
MPRRPRSSKPAPKPTRPREASPPTRTLWALRGLALALATLGLFPLANRLGAGPAVPFWNGALPQWVVGTLVIVTIAVLAVLLLGERLERFIAATNDKLLDIPSRWFAIGIAILATALAAGFSLYCYRGALIWGDEFSQHFQARLLLNARLSAVAEPYREFFNTTETLDGTGRWFSQFPIGGAVVLALGLAAHAAWLVNPILLGFTTRNVYRFASGAGDELFGRWTAIVFALCPFALFLSATQMNHAPALACITWALSALPTWVKSNNARAVTRAGIVVGLGFALAATIRPFDAALIALVVGVFQLAHLRGDSAPLRRSALLWQAAAGAVPVIILLIANWQTTGAPFLFGYDALNGAGHRPGFHEDPRGEMHTATRGLALASAYLMRLNFSLFEAPVPSLLFVIGGLAFLRTPSKWDALLAAMLVVITFGYATYWHEGLLVGGPRFLHVVLPAFVWFAVRLPATAATWSSRVPARSVQLILPLAIVAAWTLNASSNRYFGVWTQIVHERATNSVPRPDPVRDAEEAKLDNALVFVRESWHGSLAARLRALSVAPLITESVIPTIDACALQQVLDTLPVNARGLFTAREVVEEAQIAGIPEPARRRAGTRDYSLGLVPNRPLTPECARELTLDDAPPVSYARVLAQSATFDAEGRLTGRVVFARDLGARDTLLRARFGDRKWYRYVVLPGARTGQFVAVPR